MDKVEKEIRQLKRK